MSIHTLQSTDNRQQHPRPWLIGEDFPTISQVIAIADNMLDAVSIARDPLLGAKLFRDSLILRISMAAPLKAGAWLGAKIGRNIFVNRRDGLWAFRFDGSEIKNRRPIHYVFGDQVQAHMKTYTADDGPRDVLLHARLQRKGGAEMCEHFLMFPEAGSAALSETTYYDHVTRWAYPMFCRRVSHRTIQDIYAVTLLSNASHSPATVAEALGCSGRTVRNRYAEILSFLDASRQIGELMTPDHRKAEDVTS